MKAYHVESGKDCSTNSEMKLNANYIKALDLKVTEQTGIYLLAEVKRGTVTWGNDNCVFNEDTNAIFLISFNMESFSILDIEVLPPFYPYSPTALLLYYPSGITDYGVPELLLLSHVKYIEGSAIGLLIYGFSEISCPKIDGILESRNPFATKSDAASLSYRSLAINKAYSLHCIEKRNAFLSNPFTCVTNNCGSKHYYDGKICRPCHFACRTCFGPLSSQCLSCVSGMTYLPLTKECICTLYIEKGVCSSSSCSSGYLYERTCVDKCPSHTFPYTDYSATVTYSPKTSVNTVAGTGSLQFSASSSSCLTLPGPKEGKLVPKQFTIGIWIFLPIIPSNAEVPIIWGFNAFELNLVSQSNSVKAQFILKRADGTSIRASSVTDIQLNQWNYVAVSVRKQRQSTEFILYTTTETNTVGAAYTYADSKAFSYPTYVNNLILRCVGTLTNNGLTINSMGAYSLYLRNLVYKKHFHNLISLHAIRNRDYIPALKSCKEILSYWKFDTSINNLIKDSASEGLNVALPNSVAITSTNPFTQTLTAWDDIEDCIDVFSLREFPHFSISPISYPYTMIEDIINTHYAVEGIFSKADVLSFRYGGCGDTSKLIMPYKISMNYDGIVVEKDKPLPIELHGQFVDVCYFSISLVDSVRIGQVYFIVPPNQVYPSHGNSDLQISTTLTLRLMGGDQSKNDIIVLHNIDSNHERSFYDSVLVNEMGHTYPLYSMTKNDQYEYTSSIKHMDIARYILLWKPAYINSKTDNYLSEYKNLFVLWNLQSTPKIRLKMLDEKAGIVKRGVTYKGEYFYLNTIGQYQSDGDEIIFCSTGCHYSNRIGPVFVRKNGMYPPVWMGKLAGIRIGARFAGSTFDNRFFICWRSAARASLLEPGEDSWSAVHEEFSDNRAFLRVSDFDKNVHLPEIIEINPSIKERILKRGESIWFKLSNPPCPKPSLGPDGVPGKVQVVHLVYTSADEYEKELLWEETFTSMACSNTQEGFNIGKLHGNPLTCNYTITRLPLERLIPGDHYMLIIYTNSFKEPNLGCEVDPKRYLFEDSRSRIPQLEYEFIFQEAIYDESEKFVAPITREIEIRGTNIGKREVQGLGTKRFFGVKVNLAVTKPSFRCNIQSAHNIISYLHSDTQSFTISNINLAGCEGDIFATIELIKLFENSSPPLWTSEEQKIKVGTIGCNTYCDTCNGPTIYNCTSCRTDPYIYLYKGACVSKCEADLPIGLPVYERDWWLPIYYICVEKCPIGYYYDKYTNICTECNSVCETCISDSAMSCLSCKSVVANSDEVPKDVDGKAYIEKYFISNICISSCPVVTNDFSPTGENLFQTDLYSHECLINNLPSSNHPINVSIQFLAYNARVNIQSSTRLRALVDDPTHSLEEIRWFSHPAEDFTIPNFETSDERTFMSYKDGALEKLVVELNMNSLSYKTNGDEKIIIVKAKTKDSIGLGFMELIGNLPFNFRRSTVTITNDQALTTMKTIEMTITELEDPDDSVRFLRVMISLRPTALIYEGIKVDPSLQQTLPLLARLPPRTIIVYNSKVLLYSTDALTIKDIYIPPLINGPQEILEGVILDRFRCEVTVTIEDRHKGEATTRFEASFTESYKPINRLNVLEDLYDNVMKAAKDRSFSWDLVLTIANTFGVILPQPKTPLMFYMNCSNDAHCEYGKCMTSGGYSSCHCEGEYTGSNCNWKHKELFYGRAIVAEALVFLNETILIPFTSKGMFYFGDDINSLTQLSNALNTILINHELVSESYIPIIAKLCSYLGASSVRIPLRMTESDKDLILRSFDTSLSFLLFRLKSSIFWYYVFAEARNRSKEYSAQYSTLKEQTGDYIMEIRNSLYEFLLKMTVGQFTGQPPFKKAYTLFEVFINADLNETLYSIYEDILTIDLPSGTTYMKIPMNLLESVKDKVTRGEEFMIKIINWFENPYIFSKYTSQIFTSVHSFTVLNSNLTELDLRLTNPAVVFLPISNLTKDFDYENIKCREFNGLFTSSSTKKEIIKETQIIGQNTIYLDSFDFTYHEASEAEFLDYDDMSAYGTVLTTDDYITHVPCALYKSGETAAIITRFKSDFRINLRHDFYNQYDPMDYWKLTLGFYACMTVIGLFGLTYIIAVVSDGLLIPKLEKVIERNRLAYSQTEELLLQNKDSSINERSRKGDSTNLEGSSIHTKSFSTLINKKKNVVVLDQNLFIESPQGIKNDSPYKESQMKSTEITNGNEETPTTNMDTYTRDSNDVTSPKHITRGKRYKRYAQVGDIFTDEHKRKREQEEFRFIRLLLQSNPFINLIMRTNTTFHRTTRCIMLFLNIYLQMFWSAVFIAGTHSPLMEPEDFRGVTEMVGENMWIPCCTPIFSIIILYFFALLFKVSDNRVLDSRTFSQYNKLQ